MTDQVEDRTAPNGARGRTWRVLAGVLLLLLLIGVGACLLVIRLGAEGTSRLENWICGQLQAVAGGYLKPTLTFENLDYQYPSTVVVENCRLTIHDHPHGPTEILSIGRLALELTEIPKEGEPIIIDRLDLERPMLRVVGDGRGCAVGFCDLLKADASTDEGVSARPSDVFKIRSMQIRQGTFVVEAPDRGLRPMLLDRIETTLTVETAEDGWYGIELRLDRDPILKVSARGRLDLNDVVLELGPTELSMALGREHDHHMPSELQGLLAAHEVTGTLNSQVTGTLRGADPAGSQLNARLNLTQGHLSFDKVHLPVDSLAALLTYADRRLTMPDLTAQLLGGTLQVAAEIPANPSADTQLSVRGEGLRLEELMRHVDDEGAKAYAGSVTVTAQVTAPIARLRTATGGDGKLQLREGRLTGVPMINDISQVVREQTEAQNGNGRDEADITFTLEGDHVHMTSIRARIPWTTVRGDGRIYFDARLDLPLSVGPAGVAGALLGNLTSVLATYTLNGTLQEPVARIKLDPRGGTKPQEKAWCAGHG